MSSETKPPLRVRKAKPPRQRNCVEQTIDLLGLWHAVMSDRPEEEQPVTPAELEQAIETLQTIIAVNKDETP